MNKWEVTADPAMLRRMGKTGEELCEAGAVVCRIIIQGIDEVDPSSGKTNRQRLMEELADVRAQIDCTIRDLQLDTAAIEARVEQKTKQMGVWESLYQPPIPPGPRHNGQAVLRVDRMRSLTTMGFVYRAQLADKSVVELTSDEYMPLASYFPARAAASEWDQW